MHSPYLRMIEWPTQPALFAAAMRVPKRICFQLDLSRVCGYVYVAALLIVDLRNVSVVATRKSVLCRNRRVKVRAARGPGLTARTLERGAARHSSPKVQCPYGFKAVRNV